MSQCVVDVLADTDRACFVIVWIFGVTSLKNKEKDLLPGEKVGLSIFC